MEYGILHEDIITEILSCLPKKSLSRFKCVSKRWNSLISNGKCVTRKTTNSGFISQTFINGGRLHVHFFHLDEKGGIDVDDYSLIFAIENNSLSVRSGDVNGDVVAIADCCKFHQQPVIISSCNGLLLLKLGIGEIKSLYTYNPNTNNLVALPRPNKCLKIFPLGFAFDGLHYKVIFLSERDDYKFMESEFEIFSSQTGEWRKQDAKIPLLDHLPSWRNWRNSSTPTLLFKGAMHWISMDFLVIYHLKHQCYKMVKLPMPISSIKGCLWESEGCLHFCIGGVREIFIWVLHLEGWYLSGNQDVIEWELKHSAVPRNSITDHHEIYMFHKHLSLLSPVAFNDDFDIVYLQHEEVIVSYNLATGMLKFRENSYPGQEFMKIDNIYPFFYGVIDSHKKHND
ncbi:putative F-box protein At3g52320 [Magnolia sinica]|uniref:putative F-box protein At3g52320 n=1 Tax=Magnolia sinica TaxID=86752 RepID=UPI00265842D9|nr:putative F-box protein At3g52320 [Magnolia sinica]